jgi:hypothetical protein
LHIRVHRCDGKTGNYSQDDHRRAVLLAKRFDPAKLFCSGPIVIGVQNPFSIIHPDEICWIEVETDLLLPKSVPKNIERLRRIGDVEEYKSLLARQWPGWMRLRKGKEGDPFEALIELSLRSGESIYLHVTGAVGDINLVEEFFGVPAITASIGVAGNVYINPKAIVRARIYHSRDQVKFSDGFWMAEADDV